MMHFNWRLILFFFVSHLTAFQYCTSFHLNVGIISKKLTLHDNILFRYSHHNVNSIESSTKLWFNSPSDSSLDGNEISNSNKKQPNSSRYKRDDPVRVLVEGTSFAKAYTDDSIDAAVREMNRVGRGGALIFDRNENLAGIFTERDFVTKIIDAQLVSSTSRNIEEFMTKAEDLVVAFDTYSIAACRKMMVSNKIRRMPIIDMQTKKPLGIVSMSQIFRAIQAQDLELESAKFVGNTMREIELQSRDRANLLAEESGSQDSIRTGIIAAIALIVSVFIQGEFIYEHKWLSMSIAFILGYIGIIFETYFEFNKAAIALLMCTILWVIYSGIPGADGVEPNALHALSEKVSEVSEVVFFLLGAMTIVEVVDSHQGFKVVTDRIESNNKRSLIWIIAGLTFFMSAILDNLTTTIIMVSLTKKLLSNQEDRKLFGAMIVIAANAGGAWTPIGDVTTTMLWINGQISALPTISSLFLPSIVSVVLSLLMLQQSIPADAILEPNSSKVSKLAPRGNLVFSAGLLSLLCVPLFKQLTGLPPYLGMLSSLGVMWTLTDAIHAGEKDRDTLMIPAALRKIDTSGVLFFLGILLSVGALDSVGILRSIAETLDATFPDRSLIATIIGVVSALIDNVPLVAATMGMYPIESVPMDSQLWQLIAFCAGTGGSLLVIGSAAGVALMGLEKIDFLWYAKNISLSAFVGYLGGIGMYLAENNLMSMF